MMSSSETGAQHLGILWMLKFDGPPDSGSYYLSPGQGARIPATFLHAGPEVAGELAQAMQLDDPAPVLQRLSMGRHCYIARADGKIVAYGWISFDEEGIGELGLTVRLKKGEAYIWDCGTLPAYRGQRLYPALLAHMLRELCSAGLQRIWVGTDADNLPSQVGVALVGFQPVVDVFLAPDSSTRTLISRGRPGAPAQDVLDAQYALFGDRNSAGYMNCF